MIEIFSESMDRAYKLVESSLETTFAPPTRDRGFSGFEDVHNKFRRTSISSSGGSNNPAASDAVLTPATKPTPAASVIPVSKMASQLKHPVNAILNDSETSLYLRQLDDIESLQKLCYEVFMLGRDGDRPGGGTHTEVGIIPTLKGFL